MASEENNEDHHWMENELYTVGMIHFIKENLKCISGNNTLALWWYLDNAVTYALASDIDFMALGQLVASMELQHLHDCMYKSHFCNYGSC